MVQTISVVISTYNRSELLKKCLESVKSLADEIIIVDNSSSDDTVSVAKKYTKHIYTRANNLMLNVNKNYGFSKATKEWILYLDDDEEITEEVKKEIHEVLNKNNAEHGYYLPRKNIIFGKWIEHAGWYPDYQLRLFKRSKGKFPEKHVHEMVAIEGETGKLSQPFLHQNYQSILSFIQKTAIIYAPNEAENLLKEGYEYNFMDVVKMPFQEFFSRYFAREGYRDGLHGLVLSLLMASYHLFVFAFLWEKKGFPPETEKVIAKELTQEGKKIKKDLAYWQNHEQLKSASGVKKLQIKVRKLLHV